MSTSKGKQNGKATVAKKSTTKVNDKDAGASSLGQNEKKKQTFIVRTIWTFVMIAGFFLILASGQSYSILLVLFCELATFKECIAVTTASSRAKNLPVNKILNWYLVFTTIYYLNGLDILKIILESNFTILTPYTDWFILIASHHRFICYCFYVGGFIMFVSSLRKGYLKFQMASLCATHMALLFIVFQAHLIINNIINGLFWFLLPCGLVIVNDIFAYLCGITFGRTKLLEISPKKTLEGFLGAWFFTAIASIILTRLLSPYQYLICPVNNSILYSNYWNDLNHCEVNPIFRSQTYNLNHVIFERLGMTSITIKPIYIHSLNLATFASLFAPFGGFFASGLKRTFKVKDFGHSIPGHGGIADRVDCQFLMGSFTNLYFETFISEKRFSVETIVSTILLNLNNNDILNLVVQLLTTLKDRNVFDEAKLNLAIDTLVKLLA
ncbi:phosphatidate cytidylyltransferase [Monosporozyma unispora]|nr:phosphatidate cytidylyltransferase [Kazachstania unispora]